MLILNCTPKWSNINIFNYFFFQKMSKFSRNFKKFQKFQEISKKFKKFKKNSRNFKNFKEFQERKFLHFFHKSLSSVSSIFWSVFHFWPRKVLGSGPLYSLAGFSCFWICQNTSSLRSVTHLEPPLLFVLCWVSCVFVPSSRYRILVRA